MQAAVSVWRRIRGARLLGPVALLLCVCAIVLVGLNLASLRGDGQNSVLSSLFSREDEPVTSIPGNSFAARVLRQSEYYPRVHGFPVATSDAFAAARCGQTDMCDTNATLRHFTLATNYKPGLNLLLETAAHFGGGVDVVGIGDTRFRGWGHGFGVKVELLHKYAAAQAPEQLILFTDAFDVVITGSHRQIVEGYRIALQRARTRALSDPHFAGREPSILFSAELFPTPDIRVLERYPPHDRGFTFTFLNSGAMVAPAGQLVKLMDALPYDIDTIANDQFYFTDAFLASQTNASLPWIVLDHENDAFISMAGVDYIADLRLRPGNRLWQHTATQGFPLVFHFQGHEGLKKGLPKIYSHTLGVLCSDPLSPSPWLIFAAAIGGAFLTAGVMLAARAWKQRRQSGYERVQQSPTHAAGMDALERA